jgi:hypothetical protein
MASSSRNRIPTPRDLAEDDWLMDTYRGRRYCPRHPTQQMIPLGVADVCPLEHGTVEERPFDD